MISFFSYSEQAKCYYNRWRFAVVIAKRLQAWLFWTQWLYKSKFLGLGLVEMVLVVVTSLAKRWSIVAGICISVGRKLRAMDDGCVVTVHSCQWVRPTDQRFRLLIMERAPRCWNCHQTCPWSVLWVTAPRTCRDLFLQAKNVVGSIDSCRSLVSENRDFYLRSCASDNCTSFCGI